MIRGSLHRHTGRTPATDEEIRAMGAAAWHKEGIIVARLDSIKNPISRAAAEMVGNELYGRRNNNARTGG
jgi:hypothetical protein